MRFAWSNILFLFVLIFLFSSCKKETSNGNASLGETPLTPYSVQYPSYFPALTIPADNPLTLEGIQLGKKLYYDTLLSNNGNSCSSCHNSSESFSSSVANSLPHINLGWNNYFLWNGKVNGALEDIMTFEVEDFFQTDVSKFNNNPFYREEFRKVFKVEQISSRELAYALAQFFRVMVSANSLCDQYLNHTTNLSSSQMNGFVIFTTERGDCFHCHSIGLFTDNRFHNIGIDSVFIGNDRGRYNITGDPADLGLFKTPTLRNIELTPPYMHDGRFNTLEEVVDHYNSGVKLSSTLDPIMTKPAKAFGLGLSISEKQDLVAFLKTLTDTSFTNNPLLQKAN
jgi:cytochrome c peroxidase